MHHAIKHLWFVVQKIYKKTQIINPTIIRMAEFLCFKNICYKFAPER